MVYVHFGPFRAMQMWVCILLGDIGVRACRGTAYMHEVHDQGLCLPEAASHTTKGMPLIAGSTAEKSI